MDNARHEKIPLSRLLPQIGQAPYPALMAPVSDVRRFRADDELWDAYTKVVGEGARSADIKAYLEWRVENPEAPLPGRWRGPIKRRRRPSTETKPKTAPKADIE